MPIDPSIISGIRPVQIQQQDPLEQYGKSLTLKNLMLQGDQAQLAAQDENAQRQALIDSGGDNARYRALLAQRGQHKAVGALDKLLLETEEKRTTIDKNKQEMLHRAVAAHRDELANVNDPQAAAQWIASAYQDPVLAPVVSKMGTLQDSIAKIPQDPQSFQQWKQQSALGATKFIELNKPHVTTQNLGGTEQLVATPGLGGAPSVLSTTPRTQSPDSVATDARARESQQIERVKADPFGILGLNKNPSPQAAAGTGLSGDEYLKTLAPGVASQVKALAEGKLAITPRTLQSPQGAALLQMAMQYEPGTDQTVYASRQATAKDAASGKLATSNNALNTVAGHLAGLAESADKLDNTRFPWANKIKNAYLGATGDPRVKEFDLNMQGVANELERAYRGAGGSEADIKLWRESLGNASSPDQFKGVMAKGAEMLQSKLEANHAQYVQGMHGKPGDYQSITPKTVAALAKLRGVKDESATSGEAKSQPIVSDSLPDPAKYEGKYMTDTTSNTRYKAVGGKWMKQ